MMQSPWLLYDAAWMSVRSQSYLQLPPASIRAPRLALTAAAGLLQEDLLAEAALVAHPAPPVLPLQPVLAPSLGHLLRLSLGR